MSSKHQPGKGAPRHRTALAALAASLFFSLGTAHADNRFGDGVGGAMGGTGSFGSGSVTIHHNLLPEEREEIDDDIGELNNEIDALRALFETKLAQQKAQFEAKLEEQKGVKIGITHCKRPLGNYRPGYTNRKTCRQNQVGGGVLRVAFGRWAVAQSPYLTRPGWQRRVVSGTARPINAMDGVPVRPVGTPPLTLYFRKKLTHAMDVQIAHVGWCIKAGR